ncbi:hypothetical protein V7146_02920 [Gottfriedia acidiceleris]|uniref:hypothetical protein n=1 Tax=Gottfriedia acidiceleris TaxID=371036 RepID=UPI002FFFD0B1
MEQQQQESKVFRGIRLAEGVKLYKVDGSYNKMIRASLDVLADLLKDNNHKILSEYKNAHTKILIDFNCGHDAHPITPNSYKNGTGCPKCADNCPEQAKEEFLLLIQENGHGLLSEYNNTHTKVLIDFNCGHQPHELTPSLYKDGNGCPRCSGNSSEQAKEDFLSLLEKNGHKLLSKYTNNKAEVRVDFNCGHEPHFIAPSTYRKGYDSCNGSIKCPKQSEKDFKRIIKESGHELLSEFVNVMTKVLIDFKCGHSPHSIAPYAYKSGKGCPSCGGIASNTERSIKAKEYFENLVMQKGHTLLTEYKGATDKALIDFACGHEPHWITPNDYKTGYGCVRCSGRSLEQAKEEMIELVNKNGHKLLSEYINAFTKVLIDFNCSHEPHWTKPNVYKGGSGCPHCSESKGEKIIHEYLEKNEIVLISQYKFPNSIKRYDFMLPFENIIVEVHGSQHYEESYFHEKSGKTLAEEQENDRMKQEFAERLGYKYIIVDYREGNPQLALERFIESYNKLKAELKISKDGTI